MNLRKELEIEAVPQAVEERLRRVYAELPEEVPQTYLGPKLGADNADWQEVESVTERRWPWLLRGAVGVCAAVVFVALAVFSSRLAQIDMQPGAELRSDTQTFTLGVASSGDLRIGQAAVTQNDNGYHLSVDKVYHDGSCLYIGINIEAPEDAPNYQFYNLHCYAGEDTPPYEDGTMPYMTMPRVTVDGVEMDVPVVAYTWHEGHPAYDYSISVYMEIQEGQEVQVSLEIDALKAAVDHDQSYEDMDEIPVNFKADFTYQVPIKGYNMQVTSADCNSESLTVYWTIWCPEEAEKYTRLLPYGRMEGEGWSTNGGFPQEDGFLLTVDGQTLKRDPLESSITETPENGRLHYKYVYPLPEDLKNKEEELQVTLSLDNLYGILEGSGVGPSIAKKAEKIPVNLKTDFTVPVETGTVHISTPTGQDNGVSVLDVENTDELITLEMQVPMWGYELEELMGLAGLKGTYECCRLYTVDGEELLPRYDLAYETAYDDSNLRKGDMYPFTMVYEKSPATLHDEFPDDVDKVILRVYEHNPGMQITEVEYLPHIFAEFTIDLETGEAVPSDTYLKEGLIKLDSEKYLNEYHTPDFTGGYFVTGVNENMYMEGVLGLIEPADEKDWFIDVNLLIDIEEPDFEFRFYRGDELVDSVRVAMLEEYRHQVKGKNGETYYANQTDNVGFQMRSCGDEWKPEIFRTVPQWRAVVVLAGMGERPDRIQLVEQGQVLLENVETGANVDGNIILYGATESQPE